MKRYDFYGEYDYYATPVEDIDGAWIRYTDHVEAMKRIAAPSRPMVADSEQEPDCKCRRLGGWDGAHHPLCDASGMVADSAGGTVAWQVEFGDDISFTTEQETADQWKAKGWPTIALYAAPAPSASPAALTVPRSVLERAANYIELPPEGHDDGILALDLLEEINALLAAQPPAAAEAEKQDSEHADIGRLLHKAAGELPEGWEIQVRVERGWGGVVVHDSEGETTDLDDGESSLSEQIERAIDASMSAGTAPNGEK